MQQSSGIFRYTTGIDTSDERLYKNGEEISLSSQAQQQRKREPFIAENLNLNVKWSKQGADNDRFKFIKNLGNLPQDSGHPTKSDFSMVLNSVLNSNAGSTSSSGGNSGHTAVGTVSTIGATSSIMSAGSKHSWKSLTRRISAQSARATSPDESDSNDTDNMNSERNTSATAYQLSPRIDNISKASSHSFNEDIFNNESNTSTFTVLRKKSSTMLLDRTGSAHALRDHQNRTHSSTNWPSENEINVIMLVGLMVGLIISKVLQYLQLYFGWLQKQVLHLRNMCLGQGSVWDFFNFDDTSRYGMRTKLLLLPLVGTCSLLYALSTVMHFTIRFMLSPAPCGVITLIQKLITDA